MLVDDFFSQYNLPLKNKTLVVATSAGPDSMALLDMLNTIKDKYHFRLIAAHLDHLLRPDSGQEIKIIEQYCRFRQIEVKNKQWSLNLHPQTGIEAAARNYRYTWLTKVMQENHGDYLLTAHHSDDLLENILLKFIRSGNPNEMNSLQAVGKMNNRTLLRPFLSSEKADLLAYDQKHQVPFIIDETNNENDVLRNRIRHNIVPLLKQENAQIKQSALRFSKQLNEMNSLIELEFDQLQQPEDFLGVAYRIEKESLCTLTATQKTAYWQYFIWHKWHTRVNENLGKFHLLDYQKYFYLINNKLPDIYDKRAIKPGCEFAFGKRQFVISLEKLKKAELIGEFNASATAVLSAGSISQGEKLLLKNQQHAKSKKKFAENSIPNSLRPYCLTIYADQEVVFVDQVYQNQLSSIDAKRFYVYANK